MDDAVKDLQAFSIDELRETLRQIRKNVDAAEKCIDGRFWPSADAAMERVVRDAIDMQNDLTVLSVLDTLERADDVERKERKA